MAARHLRSACTLATAVLLLAGAAAVVVFLVLHARAGSTEQARREHVVAVAQDAIIQLTTVDADSASADTEQLLALSTGEFHDRFAQRADSFAKAVEAADATSEGTVASAGIAHLDDAGATVLVAASQSVTTRDEDGSGTRSLSYRFRVTVVPGTDGDGARVSSVEFVR